MDLQKYLGKRGRMRLESQEHFHSTTQHNLNITQYICSLEYEDALPRKTKARYFRLPFLLNFSPLGFLIVLYQGGVLSPDQQMTLQPLGLCLDLDGVVWCKAWESRATTLSPSSETACLIKKVEKLKKKTTKKSKGNEFRQSIGMDIVMRTAGELSKAHEAA